MVLLDDRPEDEEEDPTLLSSTLEFVERLWETAILDGLGEEAPTLSSSTFEFVERLREAAILDRLGEEAPLSSSTLEFVERLRESAPGVGSAIDGHQLRGSLSALPLEQEEKGSVSKADGDSCGHCRPEAFKSYLLRGKIGAQRLPTSFCGGEVRVDPPGKKMSCRLPPSIG